MEDLTNLSAFPKHFDGKRFYNPDAPQALGFLDALRWKLTSRPEQSPSFIWDVEPTIPPSRVDGNGLRVTLVNHSTVLLQQHGSNILTDPIWSERASPFSWIGPRRRRKPGVLFEDLPPIDAVLISHNHYDYMDLPTLAGDTGSSYVRCSGSRGQAASLAEYWTSSRIRLGRILVAARLYRSQRPRSALFGPRDFRPEPVSLVRIRD